MFEQNPVKFAVHFHQTHKTTCFISLRAAISEALDCRPDDIGAVHRIVDQSIFYNKQYNQHSYVRASYRMQYLKREGIPFGIEFVWLHDDSPEDVIIAEIIPVEEHPRTIKPAPKKRISKPKAEKKYSSSQYFSVR